ncbi:MAG: hypothetical protein ACRDUV_08145 [Pseudonocardiaceae bacterium]
MGAFVVYGVFEGGGWAVVVLFMVLMLRRPLRMLSMRPIFWIFKYPEHKQIQWAEKESERHDVLDIVRELSKFRRKNTLRDSGDELPGSSPPNESEK